MQEDPDSRLRKRRFGGLNIERLLVVGGVVAFTHSAMSIIIPVLPIYMESLGASVALGVGFTLGSMSLARFLTNIPAGIVAERLGRKKVIVTGALLVGLFGSLSGSAPGLVVFLALRFVGAIGSAMVQTSASVVVADLTTVENRGRALGLIHGVQLITGIASPAAGGILADLVDVRAPFYVSGIGAILFGLWALLRLPETRPARTQLQGLGTGGFRQTVDEARNLLRGPSFFLICMIGFVTFFTRGGASHSLVPLYAAQVIELTPGQLGLFFSGAAVFHTALVYPAGVLSDSLGRKPLIIPTNILVAISLAAFPFTTGVLQFGLAFYLLHGATGVGGQAPVAYLGDIAPRSLRGISFGMYRTFGDLAGVMAPLMLTGIASGINFTAAFIANAVLMLVVTLAFGHIATESAGKRVLREQALPAQDPGDGSSTVTPDRRR